MARIRTIKPEFWGSPKTARVSRDARLLFLGLLNESDDEGRSLGSCRRVAGALFPNDDNVTARMVDSWLNELQNAGFLCRYEVAEVAYIQVIGFTEHQRVSHPTPSRIPPPAGDNPAFLTNGSRAAPEILRPDLGSGIGRGKGNGSDQITPENIPSRPVENIGDETEKIVGKVINAIARERTKANKRVQNREAYRKRVASDLRENELDLPKLRRLIAAHPGAPIDALAGAILDEPNSLHMHRAEPATA